MSRYPVVMAVVMMGVAIAASLGLRSDAEAWIGESGEYHQTAEDTFEPVVTIEESVGQAIQRGSEWRTRSAVSAIVGALLGLVAYQVLLGSRTTRARALASFVVLAIPAFVWWTTPAVPSSTFQGGGVGRFDLTWALSTPGVAASTALVAAGLAVRLVRSWREPIEVRPISARVVALSVLSAVTIAFVAAGVLQYRVLSP